MQLKVRVHSLVNQDAEVVTIIRYNDDGTQQYVSDLTWTEFSDFDLLDISNITFPGSKVIIEAR